MFVQTILNLSFCMTLMHVKEIKSRLHHYNKLYIIVEISPMCILFIGEILMGYLETELVAMYLIYLDSDLVLHIP